MKKQKKLLVKIELFDWKESGKAQNFYHKMKRKKYKVWDYGEGSDTFVLVAANRALTKQDEIDLQLDEEGKQLLNDKYWDDTQDWSW